MTKEYLVIGLTTNQEVVTSVREGYNDYSETNEKEVQSNYDFFVVGILEGTYSDIVEAEARAEELVSSSYDCIEIKTVYV